jgi:uncharacterized OB-fold protein
MVSAMEKIEIWGYRCKRCGHIWQPRREWDGQNEPALPRICPKCKSPYWSVPRRTPKENT